MDQRGPSLFDLVQAHDREMANAAALLYRDATPPRLLRVAVGEPSRGKDVLLAHLPDPGAANNAAMCDRDRTGAAYQSLAQMKRRMLGEQERADAQMRMSAAHHPSAPLVRMAPLPGMNARGVWRAW